VSELLSVVDAAREAGDGIAIVDGERELTLEECASRALSIARDESIAVLATRTIDTVLAVYAALEARRPIALIDPAQPPDVIAKLREAIDTASLAADAALVLFTSGSTGTPRGVVLSRAALVAAAEASAAHLGWRDDDRWLVALPLAHAGGLAPVIRCLAARKPIVLAGELAASLERVTLASLVPTQLASLLEDPVWRPPPALRAVLLGGAGAPRALLETAAARGVPFLTTYGMTETFGQIATAPLARAGDPDALPVLLPSVYLDGTSPIRVRAPMLATCYLDGTPIAPAFTTADLGEFDGAALRVLGRADDMIITGGRNVHPAEVEAVLAATPGVRAACVFGVPDERWGQTVAAAIEVDAVFALDAAVAHWQRELASHARPRRLAICDAIPQLPSGKHDRRAAAALASAPVAYR
jgi:O-succinylbenzoic acid--CoA ligase